MKNHTVRFDLHDPASSIIRDTDVPGEYIRDAFHHFAGRNPFVTDEPPVIQLERLLKTAPCLRRYDKSNAKRICSAMAARIAGIWPHFMSGAFCALIRGTVDTADNQLEFNACFHYTAAMTPLRTLWVTNAIGMITERCYFFDTADLMSTVPVAWKAFRQSGNPL